MTKKLKILQKHFNQGYNKTVNKMFKRENLRGSL